MNVRARILAVSVVALVLAPMCSALAQDVPASPARHRHHKTPKAELFLGYSRFGVGLNSSTGTPGNRMVNLNGGTAAAAFNFNSHFAIVGDFGGYADSQLQLTGAGANQPRTVNSSGTVFTYLGGPRLTLAREKRVSIFAQALAGGVHASQVTVDGCAGSACTPLPTQNAFAMTAGGGVDIRLTHHISLRAVQAEYMMTRFAAVGTTTSSTENDVRLSSGLVFRFGGHEEERLPVALACSVQPQSAFAGGTFNATASATNLSMRHPAVYHWTSNAGTITESGTAAAINTTGVAPGVYTVSANLSQGSRADDQASCTTTFTITAPLPPVIACSSNPSTVLSGEPATITATASSPQNRPLTYSYTASSGSISGNGATTTLNTTGVGGGTVHVNCKVVDDLGLSAVADTSVEVTIPAPPPAAVASPTSRELCAVSFERDRKRPVRLDNEAKACLDDVALQMQRETSGRLVIVGSYSADEKPQAATVRAENERHYLVENKGIDTQRLEIRTGKAGNRTITNVFVPDGASYQSVQ